MNNGAPTNSAWPYFMRSAAVVRYNRTVGKALLIVIS